MKITEIQNGIYMSTERGPLSVEIRNAIDKGIEGSEEDKMYLENIKSKKTINLDLTKYLVKDSRLFMGRDSADEINSDLNLDYYIYSGCNLEIKIPENVIALCAGFLDNLIYYAACYLGSVEKFNSRIKFITNIYEFDKDLENTLGVILRNPNVSVYSVCFGYEETDLNYMELHDKAMFLYEEALVMERKNQDLDKRNKLFYDALGLEFECLRKIERLTNFNSSILDVINSSTSDVTNSVNSATNSVSNINLYLYYCASYCAIAYKLNYWNHVFYYANKAINLVNNLTNDDKMIDLGLLIELEEVKRDAYKNCCNTSEAIKINKQNVKSVKKSNNKS